MLDGEETVQIAWVELRREGARQHAGRSGNRANSLRRAGRERDSMLDGEETVEIAWGELRWEGARQHGTERHSMLDGEETVQIACGELGGSKTACWTERKTWK